MWGDDRGPADLAGVLGYETLEGHASQGLAIVPLWKKTDIRVRSPSFSRLKSTLASFGYNPETICLSSQTWCPSKVRHHSCQWLRFGCFCISNNKDFLHHTFSIFSTHLEKIATFYSKKELYLMERILDENEKLTIILFSDSLCGG